MLARVSLRYLARHPWQTVLSILGVALGVAVVVAIDLVNHSARSAFMLSAESVAGRATHQIIGGTAGLDETLYSMLRTTLGVTQSAPIVEGYAQTEEASQGALHILGVDPFAERPFRPYIKIHRDNSLTLRWLSEPSAALFPVNTLERLRLERGDELNVQINGMPNTLGVAGSFRIEDKTLRQTLEELVIVDIATAQELFGLYGRLSRIDLIISPDEEGQALHARIVAALPPHARIIATGTRSQALTQMTKAFQLNLTAMSLLALVVGMFLIYNTMAFSVVVRRTLIGTLRALGVTRAEVFKLILLEALALGSVGSILGLILGIVLAQGLLHFVVQTINDLYFTLQLGTIDVSLALLFKGLIIGIFVTLLAAALPALEATTTQPKAVLQRSVIELRFRRWVPYLAIFGMALLCAAGIMLLLSAKSLFLSFFILFLVIAGSALCIPSLVLMLVRLAQKPFFSVFGFIGSIAIRSISASLSRTGIAIAALTVAVAASISVTIMIDSFRDSVISWLENTLRADIYVSSTANITQNARMQLSPMLIKRIGQLPGVQTMSQGRRILIETGKGRVELFAVDMPERSFEAFRLKEGDPDRARKAFFSSNGILISEPFAYRYGLAVADNVTLPTDQGEREFPVVGIYIDYSSDQGVVTMHRKTYDRFWQDRTVSSLGIYTIPGAESADLLQNIRSLLSDTPGIIAQSNTQLRSTSIEIFDRTFAITYILRLLAVIVAFVGILSALMAIQLERAREFAVLRALGLVPKQLASLIALETGLMGIIAGVLAAPLAIILAAILVFVINQRSFGWSMQFILDPLLLAQSVILAFVAALSAAIIPAYRIARLPPAVFLRNE